MFQFAAIAVVLSTSCAFAQSNTIELTSPSALADGISAFPKLVGDNPMFAQINADLRKRDSYVLAESQACLAAKGSDWSRFIGVTFAGPRFLNYVETNDYWCSSAAHPSSDTSSVAYDLATGLAIDWRDLLPPSLVAARFPDYGSHGETVGSEALTSLYLLHYPADAAEDCPPVVRAENLRFIFRLDATEHAVIMFPAALPHAVRVCGEAATIPLAELSSLGAPSDLIAALAAN